MIDLNVIAEPTRIYPRTVWFDSYESKNNKESLK